MKKTAAPKTFEEAMSRLEEITQAMQNPQMPLEESLATFEEGQKLVRYCQSKLSEAEQKLQLLTAEGTLEELQLDERA